MDEVIVHVEKLLWDVGPFEIPEGPLDVVESASIDEVVLYLGEDIRALVEMRLYDEIRFYFYVRLTAGCLESYQPHTIF